MHPPSSSAPLALRASPRALLGFMTVAALEPSLPAEHSPRRLALWPAPAGGLQGQNVRGLVYFMGILVFASLWLPYTALAALARAVRRLAKLGGWLAPQALASSQDLLYQTLAPLAGSRLRDADAQLRTYQGEPRDGRWWSHRPPTPARLDARTSLGWSYACAPLTVDVHEVYDADQATTCARVRLARPDGQPVRLPPAPDGWDVERRDDGAVVARWAAPTAARLRALRGKAAPDDDRSAVWAAWVGELLARNGLAGGGEEGEGGGVVAWSRAAGAARASMTQEEAAREAPLVRCARPARPAVSASLRGLAGWLGSILAHSMVPATVAALFFGGSYACAAALIRDGNTSAWLAASALLVAAAWWSTASMFLPRFTRRRVRLPQRDDALRWDGRALRLAGASVGLDAPFTAHLSYGAGDGAGRSASLHVELRPAARDARPAPDRAVCFSVAAAPGGALEALPRLERDAPQVDARAFVDWIWPLIRARAALHGDRLPWDAALAAHAHARAPSDARLAHAPAPAHGQRTTRK